MYFIKELKDEGMQVTIACNDEMDEYSFETGDNSYSGGAYFYPHWAIVYLCPRSNCKELAKDVINQLNELISWK